MVRISLRRAAPFALLAILASAACGEAPDSSATEGPAAGEQAATAEQAPTTEQQTTAEDRNATAQATGEPRAAAEHPSAAERTEAGAAATQELHATEHDWEIAAESVTWARSQELAGLPTGEVAAILGATFVGVPYEPGTLEPPGPERLVVNLRTFDCVTLVEHALVLAALTQATEVDPADSATFRDRYTRELTRLRYRDAQIDGYASRLHYFTEWLDAGIERGDFEEVTDDLEGLPDERPIHFMSSNPDAYRQLSESPELVRRIAEIEERLSARTRLFVPQESIAAVEDGIRNGDIIAAVSTVDGLDIAHTGLAYRRDGRIHLLHAPLVGDSVEVSEVPLAERIQGIGGQMGIRVVRPR